VSKATHRSLLALTLIALLPGCSKEGSDTAAPAASAPPTAATEQPAPAAHPMPSAEAVANIDLSGIAKAEGGKTVAEVFAEKDQLAGTKVTIRGKVVKASANIMDRHWLHVRDGSGAEGTNDLTVTTPGTSEAPKAGDTVVVTGQVSVNKDFGIGYRYDVVIEDAEVKVEAAGS
jgi:hypothetical protein